MVDVRAEFEGAETEVVKAAVADLREILKSRKVSDAVADKAAREAEKAEFEAVGRDGVSDASKGDTVLVSFKGADTEATFVKVTDKRFTVEIDGEKKSIMFDKFVKVVSAVESDEGEDETVEADAEAV